MPRAKNPAATNPPNKQVITMPEASSKPAVRKAASSPVSPTPIDLDDQIRRRAYELYEQRGGTPGSDHEDWLRAESEVRATLNRTQSA
jgi:hypothetical protein